MSEWESFYVIVGSSGGALIGLQFVVITLIADRRALATRDSLSAFGTPTVVHLTVALIVSAIMSAPWRSFLSVSLVLMACGIGGLTYGIVVILRARRQTSYTPVLQDWIWYVQRLRGADDCRSVFPRRSTGLRVRHRFNCARTAAHRHSQCLGQCHSHRHHRTGR
jgi:hypothetical protein